MDVERDKTIESFEKTLTSAMLGITQQDYIKAQYHLEIIEDALATMGIAQLFEEAGRLVEFKSYEITIDWVRNSIKHEEVQAG